MINKTDILKLANELNIKVNDEIIQQIIEDYPSAQVQDPTGMWYQVIEQLLYEYE